VTAEVCIMNRLAVVLAADSAATVSQWTGSKYEERYFKGSNKIFQLSDHQPVGLMIFDSADCGCLGKLSLKRSAPNSEKRVSTLSKNTR
jgi:hypothetical protein